MSKRPVVIPAEAGIHCNYKMDPRLHGDDACQSV